MQRFIHEHLDVMEQSEFASDRRRASILRRLDTPERRARADQEGHTLGNLMGGRPSDNLNAAVTALKRAIERGEEHKELYGEAAAREYRERQRAYRDAVEEAARLREKAKQVVQKATEDLERVTPP